MYSLYLFFHPTTSTLFDKPQVQELDGKKKLFFCSLYLLFCCFIISIKDTVMLQNKYMILLLSLLKSSVFCYYTKFAGMKTFDENLIEILLFSLLEECYVIV